MKTQRNVYSVGQVNTYIKNMFTQDFLLQRIYVRGEVSNCKYHPSGHIYFSLKDETGTMPCVMFSGSRKGLRFQMENGQSVTVLGSISVYERDGRYQLYASEIIREGAGLLYERFEQLKEELSEMGMFDPSYKKPIPAFVKTLGIVTASTGAAIRDIMNISRRRNPFIRLVLYPALVQGEGAADSIAKGIEVLDRYGVDVIIVGRGGGSMEDLWAFNEEKVARAIFACETPVISAVGHETEPGLCVCGRGGRKTSDKSRQCKDRRAADVIFCRRQAFRQGGRKGTRGTINGRAERTDTGRDFQGDGRPSGSPGKP